MIEECIYKAGLLKCQDADLGESEPLKVTEPKLIKEKVRPSIATLLKEIPKYAPNAKIVLMGYPPLLEKSGQCVVGIGTGEAPWINEIGTLLAQEMKGAVADARAAGAKAWFSDPADDFKGKAICGDPETIHGIVADKTPGDADDEPTSAQSFHPKIAGARLYANSLEQTLRDDVK